MKKAEQKEINSRILDFIETYNRFDTETIKAEKLDYCQATIIYTTTTGGRKFKLLQSYNTIVACYDETSHILYDFLRYVYGYTATSAKHISKFRNRCGYREVLTYRAV